MIEWGFWLVLTFAGVDAGAKQLFYPDGVFAAFAPLNTRVTSTRDIEQFYAPIEDCRDAKKFIKKYSPLYATITTSACIPGGRVVMTPEELGSYYDEAIESAAIELCNWPDPVE